MNCFIVSSTAAATQKAEETGKEDRKPVAAHDGLNTTLSSGVISYECSISTLLGVEKVIDVSEVDIFARTRQACQGSHVLPQGS